MFLVFWRNGQLAQFHENAIFYKAFHMTRQLLTFMTDRELVDNMAMSKTYV